MYIYVELENFPVDCQDLSIIMRDGWGSERAVLIPELRTSNGKPSYFCRVDPTYCVLDEWEFHNCRIEFKQSNPITSRSEQTYFQVMIRFKMRRLYGVYIYNIVIYMFGITFLSLTCFSLNDEDKIGERLSLAMTLLLSNKHIYIIL